VTGAVAVVVAAVVVAISLTRDHDDSGAQVAQDPGTGETGTRDDSPAEASETPSPEVSAPVTCWDGVVRADRNACPTPTGLKGMATVFPGLKKWCDRSDARGEKLEAYVCHFDHYIVRYSRWRRDADIYGYYKQDKEVSDEPWTVGGESAGWTWTAFDRDPAETQDYQWSAAYANYPFSVSVEGKTHADRTTGVTRVKGVAVAPSHLGLE
jgi:hypothetical protein